MGGLWISNGTTTGIAALRGHTAEERYNLCESELKKEIPGNSEYGLLAEHVATLDLPLIQLVWFAAEA